MSRVGERPKGRFEPPGGCNNNPQPWQPFSSWGYLLPAPTTIAPSSEDLNALPCIVRTPKYNDTSNNTGDAQSQSTHPRQGSSTQREESREYIPQLSTQNMWRPYSIWEDSRQKYFMGSLFPKPMNGWTNSEENDFKEAVYYFWAGHGDRYDEIMQTGGPALLANTLWEQRQQEEREMFARYEWFSTFLIARNVTRGGSRLPNVREGSVNVQVGDMPRSAPQSVEQAAPAVEPGQRLRGDASVFEPTGAQRDLTPHSSGRGGVRGGLSSRGGRNIARGSSALLHESIPLVDGKELKGPFYRAAGPRGGFGRRGK